jgi:hypothetical protein
MSKERQICVHSTMNVRTMLEEGALFGVEQRIGSMPPSLVEMNVACSEYTPTSPHVSLGPIVVYDTDAVQRWLARGEDIIVVFQNNREFLRR